MANVYRLRHLFLAGALSSALVLVGAATLLYYSSYSGGMLSPSAAPLSDAEQGSYAAPGDGRARLAGLATAPVDFRAAARRSMRGVVYISTRAERQLTLWDYYSGRGPRIQEGSGSGVIYSRDGYIVTNNHVIAGAQAITVSLSDNRKFAAELVGTYPAADIAVLKIDAGDLPALRFSDSDKTEVGDWVLAVGNPYNLASTVTAGIVSARGRDIGIINDRNAIESFIQTDAAINPGNSGGALVNTSGEVVGINTAIYSRSGGYSGYGFAIPSNLAASIVDDLVATGEYRQVVLGIEAGQLDAEWAAEIGAPVTQGILLEVVEPRGAAGRAGLLAGDIIVATAGRPVRTIPQFREALGSRRGERVELTIYREGRERVVVLQL